MAIVNGVSPTLLLVPKTTGNNGWPSVVDKLINDLLDAANHLNLRSLHFTHYGFIQGYPPGLEMIRVLQAMMNPKRRSSLEVVYWDIDIRGLKELVNHYSMVARQYHIDATRPDIYMAPKFTWHEVDRTPSGHSIHVFANASEIHSGRIQ